MNINTYIQIETVPFLALALILYLSYKEFPSIKNVSGFRVMVIHVMCILLVDGICWHLNAQKNSFTMIWIFNILYFLLTEVIAYFWFTYVYNQINNEAPPVRHNKHIRPSALPLLVVSAIIITSPWNKMVFYIDPLDNSYHRGAYHIIQMICGFGYMLASSVLAYRQSRITQLTEQKKEYRFLCFVILLPFIGGTLQIINYYFVFLWPFTAAAAFLIFVDFQSHQISIDSLTALNNRGSLELYMQKLIRTPGSKWYILMIDVDHFKSINDIHGHMEGDRALQITALSLKNVFGRANAFISRYGGDEFVVIADFPSITELEKTILWCRNELNNQTSMRRLPYSIEFSIGYYRFESNRNITLSKLIQMADTKMYEQKRQRSQIK